jgi:IS5 family transposase
MTKLNSYSKSKLSRDRKYKGIDTRTHAAPATMFRRMSRLEIINLHRLPCLHRNKHRLMSTTGRSNGTPRAALCALDTCHQARPACSAKYPGQILCRPAVRHARAITFQLAEVAFTSPMMRAILAAIRRLRAPPSCA